MALPRGHKALSLAGLLFIGTSALAAFATPTTLVAIRQVLPFLQLLPEDVSVVLVGDELFFDDKEITGKVPDGTAILKVEPGSDEDLGLFLAASSIPEKLERLHTENQNPVFCDLRALRYCFVKQGNAMGYLSSGEVVQTLSGTKLFYLRYPTTGSIVARQSNMDVASSTYAMGQFTSEAEKSSLRCNPGGTVEFPSQFDPASFSITEKSKRAIEFCEVVPPLATGRQEVVALSEGSRAPRIFCDNSNNLAYFDRQNPSGQGPTSSVQQMQLTLLGKTATCDILEDGQDYVLSVNQYDPQHGNPRGEKTFVYATIGGAKSIVPVHIETFAPTELGPPCFSHNFLLPYQPNYILHTELQHETPLACHMVKAGPLRTVQREALMMKVAGCNRWMEVPAGSLLAAFDPSSRTGILKLHSYQPMLSMSGTLKTPALHAMVDGTVLGQAALSLNEASDGAGFLYQTQDGMANVSLGYVKDETFVAGSGFLYFAESSVNASGRVEYHVASMQHGSTLVLSKAALESARSSIVRFTIGSRAGILGIRSSSNTLTGGGALMRAISSDSVPETLILQRDLMQYNAAAHGIPPVGREAEDHLSMLHRLRHLLSSQGEENEITQAIAEIKEKISEINNSVAKVSAYMLEQYSPMGAKPKNVVVNMTYADKSGQLSVVLRLPVNMRESPTSSGLVRQLHVALSVLEEATIDRPPALENRTAIYGTALHTLYKILESGHCYRCTESGSCSFCRATMFRDFVNIDIQGLDSRDATMPDSFSWADYREQEFSLFADSTTGPSFIGVELDFHSKLLTDGTTLPKHLSQLKEYAMTCLNAHITSMVLQQKTSFSFCPRLNSYFKAILSSSHVADIASLMNSPEFRDVIIEGCNVRVEDAVTSCIEGDGEMLALQRLPQFRQAGHSAIYGYVRSLLSPALLGSIAEELADASSRIDDFKGVLTAAPGLRELIKTLATEAQNNASNSIVEYLLREGSGNDASALHAAIDSAVADKGVKPASGSAFYVGLWSSPRQGLSVLEEILSGSGKTLTGQETATENEAEKLRTVQQYAKRLQQDQPVKYEAITAALNWPKDKLPMTTAEAQEFVQAARREAVVDSEEISRKDEVYTVVPIIRSVPGVRNSVPERHVAEPVMPFMRRVSYSTPDLYGQVCKRLGWPTERLPQNAEEAQAFVTAMRELRALKGPVKKWLSDLGQTVSQTMTWGQIRAVIDKVHGPHSKVPFFLASSDKCQCVRSTGRNRCYIDAMKTTDDVIFRLALLVPSAVAEYISRDSKDLTTEAAAFCTATGIFVSAWQQQQVEAGFEHPNGRPAHAVLIERLKNAGDYALTEIDESGVENTSEYNKRKRALKSLFSGKAMRKCLGLMNAGAKVALEPAGAGGAKMASRSLYGGITNTVGASALHAEHFVRTIVALGSSSSRSRPPHPLTGLIAALRISQRFKDCFNQSKDMTFRAWYLMHIEGEAVIRRLNKHRLGEKVASATYNLAKDGSTRAFDKVFKTLMVTVTTQWEDSNAFRSLLAYKPGAGPVRLQEVLPEDFETSIDTSGGPILHYSPNLGNRLVEIPSAQSGLP